MSGRKNWNAYLLRYGRCVAYAAWWEQDTAHRQHLEQRAARLDRAGFRFRHKRQSLLASLEQRWAAATQSAPLP